MPCYLSTHLSPKTKLDPLTSRKRGKKIFPEMSYGVSYETPSYFITKFTLMCSKSYNNPFLPSDLQAQPLTKRQKEE